MKQKTKQSKKIVDFRLKLGVQCNIKCQIFFIAWTFLIHFSSFCQFKDVCYLGDQKIKN